LALDTSFLLRFCEIVAGGLISAKSVVLCRW
jgi:hypothetical protein